MSAPPFRRIVADPDAVAYHARKIRQARLEKLVHVVTWVPTFEDRGLPVRTLCDAYVPKATTRKVLGPVDCPACLTRQAALTPEQRDDLAAGRSPRPVMTYSPWTRIGGPDGV